MKLIFIRHDSPYECSIVTNGYWKGWNPPNHLLQGIRSLGVILL